VNGEDGWDKSFSAIGGDIGSLLIAVLIFLFLYVTIIRGFPLYVFTPNYCLIFLKINHQLFDKVQNDYSRKHHGLCFFFRYLVK
jgi:Na+/alanine symporter